MTNFNPLNFIANHAVMNLADAIKEAYEQGKRDAQPEREKGEWIPLISTSDGKHHEWCGYQCSICGERTLRSTQCNFCPHCGSYNGGEQDEID